MRLLLALFFLSSFDFASARTVNVEWSISQYEDETVQVGDKVVFSWTETIPHNVYIHPTGNCDQDGRIFVGNDLEGTYSFLADDVGEMVFVCDIPGHCQAGQSIKFIVEAQPESTTDESSESTAEAPVSNEDASDSSSGVNIKVYLIANVLAVIIALMN